MVRFKICPLATCDTTYVCVDKQLEERGCCSKLFKVQLSLANFELFSVWMEVLLDGSEEEVERYTLQDGLSSPQE